jgi:hypothetical protein
METVVTLVAISQFLDTVPTGSNYGIRRYVGPDFVCLVVPRSMLPYPYRAWGARVTERVQTSVEALCESELVFPDQKKTLDGMHLFATDQDVETMLARDADGMLGQITFFWRKSAAPAKGICFEPESGTLFAMIPRPTYDFCFVRPKNFYTPILLSDLAAIRQSGLATYVFCNARSWATKLDKNRKVVPGDPFVMMPMHMAGQPGCGIYKSRPQRLMDRVMAALQTISEKTSLKGIFTFERAGSDRILITYDAGRIASNPETEARAAAKSRAFGGRNTVLDPHASEPPPAVTAPSQAQDQAIEDSVDVRLQKSSYNEARNVLPRLVADNQVTLKNVTTYLSKAADEICYSSQHGTFYSGNVRKCIGEAYAIAEAFMMLNRDGDLAIIANVMMDVAHVFWKDSCCRAGKKEALENASAAFDRGADCISGNVQLSQHAVEVTASLRRHATRMKEAAARDDTGGYTLDGQDHAAAYPGSNAYLRRIKDLAAEASKYRHPNSASSAKDDESSGDIPASEAPDAATVNTEPVKVPPAPTGQGPGTQPDRASSREQGADAAGMTSRQHSRSAGNDDRCPSPLAKSVGEILKGMSLPGITEPDSNRSCTGETSARAGNTADDRNDPPERRPDMAEVPNASGPQANATARERATLLNDFPPPTGEQLPVGFKLDNDVYVSNLKYLHEHVSGEWGDIMNVSKASVEVFLTKFAVDMFPFVATSAEKGHNEIAAFLKSVQKFYVNSKNNYKLRNDAFPPYLFGAMKNFCEQRGFKLPRK